MPQRHILQDPMTAFLSKYWEWGYRGLVMIGLGVTIGTIKASYVTKEEIRQIVEPIISRVDSANAVINARIGAVETTLAVMAEQNKANARQDDILRDLEVRMRATERELNNQDRAGLR